MENKQLTDLEIINNIADFVSKQPVANETASIIYNFIKIEMQKRVEAVENQKIEE